MKKLIYLTIFCVLVTGCQAAPAPVEVATPNEQAATNVPTAAPAPSATPAPTALPGKVVIPIESMQEGIPWLSGYSVAKAPGLYFVGFNTEKAPFDNELVRRALALAINKEELLALEQRLYRNVSSVANLRVASALTPPEVLGRDLNGEIGIRYNPEEARALLAQAGYSDPALFPAAEFRVSFGGDQAPGAWTQIAEAIVEMWTTNLGITSIEVAQNSSSYYASLESDPPEIFYVGWYADYLDPNIFIKELFISETYFNYTRFNDEAFTDLILKAESIADPSERQLLYLEAERALETMAPLIPLFYYTHVE